MPSSLYELKEILLTYQKLIKESLQCQQVISESSSTNQETDSISPSSSVANSKNKELQDWLDFYDFLKQNDIIKENTYGNEFPSSSDYIRYRNSGESGSSGCFFDFIFGSETVHCEYSRANKGALFNKYFTSNINERVGLALGMFCLNKMKERFPKVVTCNAIEIDQKQIPLCASINDAWEFLHPTDLLSEISDEKEKFLFKDFLQNKSSWRVLMEERLTQNEKSKIYQDCEENYPKDKKWSLKIFKILQKGIISKLEETPLGVYFLDKFIESKKNNSLDVQVIRFIQGIVTIYIDLERSTEEADYKKIGTVDSIQVKLRYRVQVDPSIFKAISSTFFEKLNGISDNVSKTPFAQEDYIRVLYSVARCCRENAGHMASAYHVRKKISELFPDVYTEEEKTKILKALCNEFLSRENAIYRFKNKAHRLFIDGLGTAKYTEENLLSFISAQHGIDRKTDNVPANSGISSNMQFDHINELRYETLMVYAAAFVENTKERDRVLKQLLNVIDDFDVRERRIQASVVHTLSYILLDCDYLIPNSLRERIFQSTFGKNAYPLQKKIGRHLLKKEYYKNIYEKSITEALEKTADAKYAKRDSLFFLHVHLDLLPQDVDRNCKTAVDAYKQAVELFDSFWDTRRVRITRSEYEEVIEQIKNFVKGTMKDSSETLPVLENLLEIHIAEYLLYSFADVSKKWEIQNNDGLIEVQKLAVIVDYSKKKKCYSYNHEDWQSGMYMTCGATRALAAIAHQKIQQNEKFNLSDEVKNDWKRWLRKELTVAYESTGSLRYTLFMIRLLSLTNINVEELEDIIWNPDNILYSSTSAEEKAFKKGKQAFQQCFETTCFLEYDAFPSDYDSVCNLLGLNRLKNTK